MPAIVADAVDAYVVRRVEARVQVLLFQRGPGQSFAGAWQSVHARVDPGETALTAAWRAVTSAIACEPAAAYSADYLNQFYDHERDLIVIAPSIAFVLPQGVKPTVSGPLQTVRWFDCADAMDRLLWSGQRGAVLRLGEIFGRAGEDSALYRIG
jgi:8-oxo-dGTP pyrophosphatase MutT (NUDIX family)